MKSKVYNASDGFNLTNRTQSVWEILETQKNELQKKLEELQRLYDIEKLRSEDRAKALIETCKALIETYKVRDEAVKLLKEIVVGDRYKALELFEDIKNFLQSFEDKGAK